VTYIQTDGHRRRNTARRQAALRLCVASRGNEHGQTSLGASINLKMIPPRIVYPTSRNVKPMVEKRNATKLLRQPTHRRTRCIVFVCVTSFEGAPTTACRRALHRFPFVTFAAVLSRLAAKLFPDLSNFRILASLSMLVD